MSGYYGYGNRSQPSTGSLPHSGNAGYGEPAGYAHSQEHMHGYSSYNPSVSRASNTYHQPQPNMSQQQSYTSYPSQQRAQPPPPPQAYQTGSQGYLSRPAETTYSNNRMDPMASKRDQSLQQPAQAQHSSYYPPMQGTENKPSASQQAYSGYGSKSSHYGYSGNGDIYSMSYPDSANTYTSSSSTYKRAPSHFSTSAPPPPSSAQATIVASQASTAASAAAAAVVAAAAAAAAASQSAPPGSFQAYDSGKYIGFDSSAYLSANSNYYQVSFQLKLETLSWWTKHCPSQK